ncbi:hypothetical protein BJ138DRAFT_779617 [Hygrophoropsis aurantiaca]|uniref:Uncharacterized protein n=1 Tax=Hygrophoropsis aurantiaca TaxID=72124 RepID=A0ACB7ZWC9_9AGAM|nr:hypothetical protein BJ138DRAFT_779617 [Hygrophoropsis aurantiaca]
MYAFRDHQVLPWTTSYHRGLTATTNSLRLTRACTHLITRSGSLTLSLAYINARRKQYPNTPVANTYISSKAAPSKPLAKIQLTDTGQALPGGDSAAHWWGSSRRNRCARRRDEREGGVRKSCSCASVVFRALHWLGYHLPRTAIYKYLVFTQPSYPSHLPSGFGAALLSPFITLPSPPISLKTMLATGVDVDYEVHDSIQH